MRCGCFGRLRNAWAVLLACGISIAEDRRGQPPASAPSSAPAQVSGKFQSLAWGIFPDPDVPDYVRSIELFPLRGKEGAKWFDVGIEHRSRYEHRHNDYRRAFLTDDDLLQMRTFGYLGVREALDPLRFGFEFQDARQFESEFPEPLPDINEHEVVQAYAELYFRDPLGPRFPVRFQAGRFTMDYSGTRLVIRPRWRNTLIAYDGVRMRLGTHQTDWQLDAFATRPEENFLRKADHPDDERAFYGVVGTWRKWDKVASVQPYYFVLDEDRRELLDRTIHTLGYHLYGPIGQTGFDYDLNHAYQFGESGHGKHCAFASNAELGYRFTHSWKPRISFSHTYASGDLDPNDLDDDRFERLFYIPHPFSTSDLIDLRNVNSPKLRLEFQPHAKLRLDGAFGGYWLANADDGWPLANRRDPTGSSGGFMGSEIELRGRYQLNEQAGVEIGYSHFFMGTFAERTGESGDLDFFYMAVTWKL